MKHEREHDSNNQLNNEIKCAVQKQLADEVKKEYEKMLHQPYVKSATTEKLNNAFMPILDEEKEKLQYLELGQHFIEYVEINKKQSEDINRLIQDTAETIAKLKIASDKRFSENLTYEQMEALLEATYRDYAKINAAITSDKLATEFQNLSKQIDVSTENAFRKVEGRINLLILLQVLCILVTTIF